MHTFWYVNVLLNIHCLLYFLLPILFMCMLKLFKFLRVYDIRVKDPFVPSTIPSCVYFGTADGGHFDDEQTFTLICKVSPRLVGSYSSVCELCEC